MSFGKNLKLARKAMKFSRKEVATRLGITLSAYSNYENGSREPKFDILREISSILNVSTDYLLDIDANERKAHCYNLGLQFMKDIGYKYIDNPFDLFQYAEFDLYFAPDNRNDEDLSNIVAFRTSHFIEMMETPQKFLPEYSSDKARIFLLGEYTEKFIVCEGKYSEWLSDLNRVMAKTKNDIPCIYDENHKRAYEITKKAAAEKGYATKAEADLAIKTLADVRPYKYRGFSYALEEESSSL